MRHGLTQCSEVGEVAVLVEENVVEHEELGGDGVGGVTAAGGAPKHSQHLQHGGG